MRVCDAIKIDGHNIRHIRLLLAHVLKTTANNLICNPDRLLSDAELLIFNEYIKRLNNHEPLSKIIGKRYFWNDEFIITKDTLDPRPDTETIIESVMEQFPADGPYKILDLGTGTGCIILSLLQEYPNATGLAVDISQAALDIAQQNAHRLKLSNRITFKQNNWCDEMIDQFDIIVSNPPYIKTDELLSDAVKNFDPHQALFAGKDGMDAYKEIAESLKKLCHNETLIFLEIGQGQQDEISLIFANNGFKLQSCKKDISGIIRCLAIKIL